MPAILMLAAALLCRPAEAVPRIAQVIALPGAGVELVGSGFGAQCPSCEVHADYGMGWRYALQVANWSDTRIVARLPDLNSALEVAVTVHTPDGASPSARARVRRERVPAKDMRDAVRGDAMGLRVFEVASSLKVGDSGEENFDVSQPEPTCRQASLVFDQARLVFVRQRFAEAAIVAAPPAGCSACALLRVRWYHEPTGHIDLQVHVYQRRVEGICAPQLRH